jgi:hypothetical protein
MTQDRIAFRLAALSAIVSEGVPLEWMGQIVPSGPLTIDLDEGPSGAANRGELNYARRQARAEFHVRIELSELTDVLAALGVDPALMGPVRAMVRSAGHIRDDHSLALSGPCQILPHVVFGGARAAMLPGR